MHEPHPMSERDYSWQPLSLHTISLTTNSFFFSLFYNISATLSSRFLPVCPPVDSAASSCLDLRPVSIYVLACHSSLTRASLLWEMNFLSVQTCLFRTPYFVIYRSIASSICTHLTNVRLTRSLLATSSLLTSLITASPTVPRFRLGKFIILTRAHETSFSGLTSSPKLHVVGVRSPVYVIHYRRLRHTHVYIHSHSRLMHSCLSLFFVPEPGLHDLAIRKLIPSHSSVPGYARNAFAFAGDCAKHVPFCPPVHLRICGHTVHVPERASSFNNRVSDSPKVLTSSFFPKFSGLQICFSNSGT